jgi:lysozyme
MKLGNNGEALIKSFEQLRLDAYKRFPTEPWTIGWGHTKGVQRGDTCTFEQARIWFLEDTAKAVDANNALLTVPVSQNQFDALASFAYNAGIGAESHSTLLRLVNSGQNDLAAAEFVKWDHVNGVEVAGLKRRREAEAALYKQPDANVVLSA